MGIRDHMAPGAREIFSRIGDPGVYTYETTVKDSSFILHEAVDVLGDIGQVIGRRDEMSLLVEDIPSPLRTGTILLNGVTWILVEKLFRSGYYERWAVKRG